MHVTVNFLVLFFSDRQNIFRSDKIFMSVSPNDWQLLSKFREVCYCVLNLFICCTLYAYVLLTIQCSHWPWLGWKSCLIIKFNWSANVHKITSKIYYEWKLVNFSGMYRKYWLFDVKRNDSFIAVTKKNYPPSP